MVTFVDKKPVQKETIFICVLYGEGWQKIEA